MVKYLPDRNGASGMPAHSSWCHGGACIVKAPWIVHKMGDEVAKTGIHVGLEGIDLLARNLSLE